MESHRDAFDLETMRDCLVGQYLSGQCTAFAIAVHRRTGWPLVALRGQGGELIHSACLSPDGLYVDARGFLDRDGVTRQFEWTKDVVPSDAGTLLGEHPQDERLIDRASLHADLLLDLPGKGAHRARYEAFADALATICREHGMWLRGPYPGVCEAFIAYEAYGEETGFDVRIMPVGGVRLERRLG